MEEHVGDVVIRRAVESDIPSVILVNQLSLPENYPEYFFYMHLNNWGEAFYVAEDKGRIVGYIMPRIETGFGFFSHFIVKKGHVVSIAVLEGYRRRGIATRLMEKSMESMRERYGAKEVYLEVRVANEPAIRLYEKLGFEKIKVIKNYYSDGMDAYLMARRL